MANPRPIRPHQIEASGGFSLLELLTAMSLALLLSNCILQALSRDTMITQHRAANLRQRHHQRRVMALIQQDVLANQIISLDPKPQRHSCELGGRIPVLHLSHSSGSSVTYSVGASPAAIWRGTVLMRCGSAFGIDGRPSNGIPQNRVLLDEMGEYPTDGDRIAISQTADDSGQETCTSAKGFQACVTSDGRLARISISMSKAFSSRTVAQE